MLEANIEKHILQRVFTLQKINEQRKTPTNIESCYCIKKKYQKDVAPIIDSIVNNRPMYELFNDIKRLDCAIINSFIADVMDASPRTDVAITAFNNIKTVLHPYQINNVNWMINIENRNYMIDGIKYPLKGGGLFDEPTMGKTLQMITLINQHKSNYKSFYKNNKLYSRATLLILPTHLCEQWEREFTKHQTEPLVIIKLFNKHHYRKYSYYELMNADVVIVLSRFFINCELDPHELTNRLFDITNIFEKCVNIFKIYWYRIAIDEFHEMENNEVFHLIKYAESDNRWIISGTPLKEHIIETDTYKTVSTNVRDDSVKIINVLIDSSIGQIINYLSWDDGAIVKYDFTDIKQYNYLLSHFSRNTKSANMHVLKLPKIKESVVWLNFTDTERTIYNSHVIENASMNNVELRKLCCHPLLCDTIKTSFSNTEFTLDGLQEKIKKMYLMDYENAKDKCSECSTRIEKLNGEIKLLEKDGKTDLMKYTDLQVSLKYNTEKLTEFDIILKKKYDVLKYYINFIEILNDVEKITVNECVICLDNINLDNIGVTSCTHMFCYTCIHQYITSTHNKKCPLCKSNLQLNDIYAVRKSTIKTEITEVQSAEINKYGTKLAYIIKYIKSTPNKYRIIFSQWDDMLITIGKVLTECGIKNVFCRGGVYQKANALRLFDASITQENNDVKIMMLSSKTNISGSNLTMAQEVIFTDPFYASKQERINMRAQAMARLCRLGNMNEYVDIIDILIRNTVEENIYKHNCTEDKIEMQI